MIPNAVLRDLLLPPALAALLCAFLGYPIARLALPDELRPYRALLAPLAGCALFLCVAAALTTLTALTPPQIAAGLAALAVPVNAWLLWRWARAARREAPGQKSTSTQPSIVNRQSSIVTTEALPAAICHLLAALVFALAILPPLRWGASLPIGSNWDAAEFYVPLGRALQLSSQRDFAELGRNPLIRIFTTPPVSGRIHAFSYLHAAASGAAGVDPLRAYAGMMALVLALQPLAIYPLGRVVGLPRAAALLAAALSALAWLPLWATYNSFSSHVMSLPLLPVALASSIVALRMGGRRAILSGALFAGGLATGYYPAMTAYVALLAPAGAYLLWAAPGDQQKGRKGEGANGGEIGDLSPLQPFTPSPPHLFTPNPIRRLIARGLLLGALAFVISGAAQAYFFLRPGYLGDMLRSGTGFQVNEFVSLTDALGLTATFNRESLAADARLVVPAAAMALALGLAGIFGRRAPLLAAMAAGAALYQGYTVARAYHYGFYKGVTFEIPLYALLIASGAAWVWERTTMDDRRLTIEDQASPLHPFTPSPLHLLALRLMLAAGLALLLGLNTWTTWGIQRHYTSAGPQLWSLADLDALDLREQTPPGAAVLVAPEGRPEVFASLLSYALLGHDMVGRFKTGYGWLDASPRKYQADLALLPDDADPSNYGYQTGDLRWAGAGMRLYGRAPDVLYHRALGTGGRYPALAPGGALTLDLARNQIRLSGESAASPVPPSEAKLALAVASFEPTALEFSVGGATRRYDLPGGLALITGDVILLPQQAQVRNVGGASAYLWWGEIRAPDAPGGVEPRDDVFVQVAQAPASGANVAADITVRTASLPDGAQKLTAVAVVAHTAGSEGGWKEIGQWVFFPSGDRRLRLAADLAGLKAALTSGEQPADLVGAAQPAGDGRYRVTLLLANNAQIVYGTNLWTWKVKDGKVQDVAADSVTFDVVPLPRAATPLEQRSADGAIRLRGYTLLRPKARPGEKVALSLLWQGLRAMPADLRARATLRDGEGRALAEQTLPIGARDHGASRWQPGEVAEQPLALAVPNDAPVGIATVSVELLGADGQPVAFEGGAQMLSITNVEIVR